MRYQIDVITSRFNLNGRFDEMRSQSVMQRFSNLKPLSEFFNLRLVSKPNGWGEAQSRMSYNLSYFSSNYALLFVMFFIYSLITNLTLLFVIILVVGGMWGIGKLGGQEVTIGTYTATTTQMYTTLWCVAIPLLIWSGPFATMLWLIGASGVTILGHASFMDKPIESAFSEEAV
jgi:hypothetical protein